MTRDEWYATPPDDSDRTCPDCEGQGWRWVTVARWCDDRGPDGLDVQGDCFSCGGTGREGG